MNEVKQILKHLGVKPSKERGQNFLVEEYVIDEIMQFACLSSDENLVEIGPGLGMLTKELMSIAPTTVIEIEEQFAEYLEKVMPDLNIINEDVRFVDFSELGENLVVLGNLPYSFSSDILNLFATYAENIKRAIVMLQKEYAQRICSVPGKKSYGPLSVFTQAKAHCIPGPIFPPDCFFPPPKIESQVIELRFEPNKYNIVDDLTFKQTVLALFKERRKKISGTLKKHLGTSEEQTAKLLATASLDTEIRPDSVTVEQFIDLSNVIFAER